MTPSIGMAIKITEFNREKIAVVNGGLAPKLEDVETYFFFPYSYDAPCEILTVQDFNVKYRFANTPNELCFIDVDKL
jgi:hypothetical protein